MSTAQLVVLSPEAFWQGSKGVDLFVVSIPIKCENVGSDCLVSFCFDQPAEAAELAVEMHRAMTADELMAYASGECRAACKHVWFLFLIDEKITEPCLPDILNEQEFESVQAVASARGIDPEHVTKCYQLDTCLNPDQYRLITNDLVTLKELHDAIFSDSLDWQAKRHMSKRTPAYRVSLSMPAPKPLANHDERLLSNLLASLDLGINHDRGTQADVLIRGS